MLFTWVYNNMLGKWGIIAEEECGRYNVETYVYYPIGVDGHDGRGYVQGKYRGNRGLFYTDDLMDRRFETPDSPFAYI